MSEAVRVANEELGPVAQLLAFYADGSDAAIAGATKLTLGMIAETAEWFDGRGDPRAPEAAEKVRGAWINHIRRAGAELDAEDFDQRWAAAFAKARVELAVVRGAEIAEQLAEADAEAEPKAEIKFDPSDHAPRGDAPPTIEERDRALEKLADLWDSDPLAYAESRKEWAKRLCTTMGAIDKAVKIIRDKRTSGGDQTQATKLASIARGKDVELWHSPAGEGFATMLIDGCWRANYRIQSTKFERWLTREYGRQNQIRINGKLEAQTPATSSVRDAMKQIDGYAVFNDEVRQPAIRVGGNEEVIWIDLGKDGRAVRVTASGWDIVSGADVAFIRSDAMLPLPKPVPGGSLEALKRVLNVATEDFPLPVGWLLQTWNPIGPYPLIDISGKSGVGKTLTLEMLLRVTDPNSAGVRKPPSKIQDVFIAAKNNWLIGYDNMSAMPKNLSDAFCQLATGITDATRSHYTNDEEHVITVERPFIVSGIAQHLTERADLASRAVKLYLPPLRQRAGRIPLRQYFAEKHGEVLGKFLDGLVGALRDAKSIRVANPARLIEFEQFAEAGCRAMGFPEGEFVRAYAANRRDSMLISLEADCIGRAVRSFMQSKVGAKGFAGSPNELLKLLSLWKPTTLAEAKEWPSDAPRLTTALDRVTDPLAAIGIACVTRVDRRNKIDRGGQRDVILRLA